MTLKEIDNLINESLFANLGFIDSEGKPSIRRVFCTWHKGLGNHLISTNTSSMHVQDILKNKETCLYFENSERFEGICFTGECIVHMDREFKEKMWKEGDEQYYPNGVEDEDYCVLEFVAKKGRFYRYDGIGNISFEEMQNFGKDAEWSDNYDSLME